MADGALQGQAEFDDISQVFRWNYIMMTILGLWPAELNNIRFFLIFGYFCCQTLLDYIDLYLSMDDLEMFLMTLNEIMAFTQIFTRMLMLRVYNNDLGEVISDAQKDFDANDYTEEERKTFAAYHVKSRAFVKLLIIYTALTATAYYIKPLLGQMGELTEFIKSNGENSSFIIMLPYRFHVFYEMNDAKTYFWTYGSLLPFLFVSGLGQSTADCLMVTLVYHVSGQMAVLAMRITRIDCDPSKCTQEVQKIVKAHIRLIRMGKIIQTAFSATLLVHLVGATILVCILGYQILVGLANGEKALLVSFFSFILLVLLILYSHCIVGENLLTESDRVYEAYYNCEWYKMSVENAKIILMCLARSQKPMQLTAGKFTIFCHQTLTNSIKTAMGYLSVLRTVL